MSMQKTIISEAAIVDNQKIVKPAVIEIKDNVITKISSIFPKKQDNVTKLDNYLLLPGFTNAHCHLELTNIGPLEKLSFVNWMTELVKNKLKQSSVDKILSVKAGCKSLIDSGVTTIIDHISFDTPTSAFSDLPVFVIGFGETVGAKQEVAHLTHKRHIYNKDNIDIPYYVTPHAIHSVNSGILKQLFKNKKEAPFSIHLHESMEEKEYFEEQKGAMVEAILTRWPDLSHESFHKSRSAIQYLQDNNYRLDHSLIIHANVINEKDIAILNSWHNVCVVHCPGSHDFFGHEHFPFDEYKKRGIKVALGTDSIASNTCLNYLHEIKLFLKKYPQVDFWEILPMITTNALETIGITNKGKISVGYDANMIGMRIDTNETVSVDFLHHDTGDTNSKIAWTSI